MIIPRGEAHTVKDSPNSAVHWLDTILERTPPVNGRLDHGGGGQRSCFAADSRSIS